MTRKHDLSEAIEAVCWRAMKAYYDACDTVLREPAMMARVAYKSQIRGDSRVMFGLSFHEANGDEVFRVVAERDGDRVIAIRILRKAQEDGGRL